jgi:two-component system NtrC family sensor kinase
MSAEQRDVIPSQSTARRIDLAKIHPILPQLIDSLSDAVLVVDRSQRVVAANRRYIDAFGRESARVAGSVCSDAVRCPDLASGATLERCATCDVLHMKRPTRRLCVLPDATGAQRRWEGTFSPVFDQADEITHVVEVWRDVSDRSHLESQLSHSERLASLGVLAAGVAHEINNPLASIVAGVESLGRWLQSRQKDEPEDPRCAEATETLALLEREARRVQEITEKLMLLAQPYSVEATWADLNRAASDTIRLLRFEMQRRGIQVVEDLDPDLPAIWAKETSLRSTCMNLMMNAVQATSKEGAVTVRTRRLGIGGVSLEISDTGAGIAPQHMDRIWDPFFTTKPTGQGTGLGLSITQRIVTRHGGRIRAENLDTGGARFTVELPIHGPGGAALA